MAVDLLCKFIICVHIKCFAMRNVDRIQIRAFEKSVF